MRNVALYVIYRWKESHYLQVFSNVVVFRFESYKLFGIRVFDQSSWTVTTQPRLSILIWAFTFQSSRGKSREACGEWKCGLNVSRAIYIICFVVCITYTRGHLRVLFCFFINKNLSILSLPLHWLPDIAAWPRNDGYTLKSMFVFC